MSTNICYYGKSGFKYCKASNFVKDKTYYMLAYDSHNKIRNNSFDDLIIETPMKLVSDTPVKLASSQDPGYYLINDKTNERIGLTANNIFEKYDDEFKNYENKNKDVIYSKGEIYVEAENPVTESGKNYYYYTIGIDPNTNEEIFGKEKLTEIKPSRTGNGNDEYIIDGQKRNYVYEKINKKNTELSGGKSNRRKPQKSTRRKQKKSTRRKTYRRKH